MSDIDSDVVHLARLWGEGRDKDVVAIFRRVLREIAKRRPELADQAQRFSANLAHSIARTAMAEAVPVDADTRLELLRREVIPDLPHHAIWPAEISDQLSTFVAERRKQSELEGLGLSASRSLLFVGPPGVGKSMAARWLAKELNRPLLTLDLAAVMSSFLGKTGSNIRSVLQYAQREPSVLLLDEFDAIAKRRDDTAEIGELKRLVTVLVQAIDDWPSAGVLVAATNHPELLDSAVWRRFDRVIKFPLPTGKEIGLLLHSLLQPRAEEDTSLISTISTLLHGCSFADAVQYFTRARREAVLKGESWKTALLSITANIVNQAPLDTRLRIASDLGASGHSQRSVSQLTGLSRDTIRKHLPKQVADTDNWR